MKKSSTTTLKTSEKNWAKILSRQFGGWVIKSVKKIRSSLSAKLFLQLFCILTAACFAIVIVIQHYLPKNYSNKVFHNLTLEAEQLIQTLEEIDQSEIEDCISDFCMKNGTEAELHDKNGVSLYKVNLSNSLLIKETKYGEGLGLSFINSNTPYTLLLSLYHDGGSEILDVMIGMYPLILGVILTASLVIAFLYSRFTAKPIVAISHTASRMTKLDMTWKCDINRTDEIGILADNLNKMSSHLNAALNDLQTANDKLQEDMKKEREQIRQRSNLFMAISHELKTPLTILKGETEGMIHNLEPFINRDKYLLHSLQIIETMEKLIQDILVTARIQMLDKQLSLTPCNITQLILDAIELQKDLAEYSNIKIQHDLQTGIFINLDKELFHKILISLINNGLVHSGEGAAVIVKNKVRNSECILTIENTNALIPADEIKHIFEPFYKVDKSRTSSGNGLGLYLVKAFLDFHDFKYNISNTDKGVLFTIIMPIEAD